MKKIFKYRVTPGFYTVMPVGAEVLSVGQQGADVMAWALIDDEVTGTVGRKIAAYGTGHPVLEEAGKFICTVQMTNGLVFHFFDYGEQPENRTES